MARRKALKWLPILVAAGVGAGIGLVVLSDPDKKKALLAGGGIGLVGALVAGIL